MPVEDRDDQHTLRFNNVDESIRTDDEFPAARKLGIRDLVASVGRVTKGFGSINGELSKVGGIRGGVPGNELNCRFQVVDGGLSPDYLASHLERRFFTCSWLWTRPSAAACMLRSTFWRTYSRYWTSSSVQLSGRVFTRSRTARFTLLMALPSGIVARVT
jgi:hypothetical protein